MSQAEPTLALESLDGKVANARMRIILNTESKVQSGLELIGCGRLCALVGMVEVQQVGAPGPKRPAQGCAEGRRATELADG